jgi:hypothetical protein
VIRVNCARYEIADCPRLRRMGLSIAAAAEIQAGPQRAKNRWENGPSMCTTELYHHEL